MSKRLSTMADVAASVGVSSRDVALVLAADQRVPADLRSQITVAIGTAGYRPLEGIQTQIGRPLRLAIVFRTHRGDDPEANRFYTRIASTIDLACRSYGAEVIQATMSVDDRYEPVEITTAFTDGSCDGAFIIGTQLDVESVERLTLSKCPLVLVDGYSAGATLDSVVTDNVNGGWTAVEHLIEAGHREIAMLGTEPGCYPSMLARRAGYLEAIEAHGLARHLIDTDYVLADTTALLGLDYVERHPEVTAIFCANDLIGTTFMQAARDAGYQVPADISLVGFDDIDLASLVMPSLTTLAIDKVLMGRAGFALLAHRLEAQSSEPIEAIVVPHLVERESVLLRRDHRIP